MIQDNIFDEKCYGRFIETFDRFGLSYEVVKCVPFSNEIIPPIDTYDAVVAIGSYGMTNTIAKTHYPGSWTNDNYRCSVWQKKWKGLCFNEGTFHKFGEVPFQEKPFFIRPDGDDKLFTGCVKDWDQYQEWREKVSNLEGVYTTLDLNSMVLISEPKPIVEEYRFVVIDGKVVSGSTYGSNIIQQHIKIDDSILIEFVKWVIGLWTPSDVFVLDVVLSGGEYYVMEMGNFNSAGLYENDIQLIVQKIEEKLDGCKNGNFIH